MELAAMTTFTQKTNFAYFSVASILIILAYARAQDFGEAKLVYEWKTLEFEWPSEREKQESIDNNTYHPGRSLLAGVKVYKDVAYVSIPRWFWTSGIPVTVAKVISVEGKNKLRPYPTWAAQKQGNCNALQYVQGMEIDPNTGYMYVIDTGRIGNALNLCPAKIVIYDLNTDTEIQRYELDEDVVSRTSNFLNDIVLDYVDGNVRYAYVTNTYQNHLVVYDFQNRSAHYVEDPSMRVEANNASVITINGRAYNFSVAVDGIAMSPDFKYVYYCVLGGYNLYQVPTSALRQPRSSGDTGVIRLVGKKVSQTDGLAHGSKRLYFGALGASAVYYWDSDRDMATQKVGMDQVSLASQVQLVRDNVTMQWPDTFGFDEHGWIWFISNRLQDFAGTGLPEEGDTYMRVWKVYANDTSYMYQADRRTRANNNSPALKPVTMWPGYALHLPVLFSLLTIWTSQKVTSV